MNRSHLWKLIFILFVVVWAIKEITPLGPRNLTDQFAETATLNLDPGREEIIKKARALDAKFPERGFGNLAEAIGSSNILKYFPSNYVNLAISKDPTRDTLNRLQREAAGQVKLGLDLQGGVEIRMAMDTSRLDTNQNPASTGGRSYYVDQAIEVLRKRVDRFGVAEPILQAAGENQILVQLPGLSENQIDEAKRTLSQAAFLEFRMVDPDMENSLRDGIVKAGYERKKMKRVDKQTDREYFQDVIVRKTPEKGFTGSYITSAMASPDPMTGAPEIHFSLNTEGAKLFGEITTENVGRSFATMLDGEVVSIASIREPITGGQCRITGSFSDKEALQMASNLENPLKAPLRIEATRVVEPSLGKESIQSGYKAALIGVAAVALFMLVYYFVAGAIADIALMLNVLILLGVMCSIDTTLTLPGIAGIVLTIGMAVDANVLIYERIREELQAGKSVRGAVSSGYQKAFGTILDSNLTTMISSVLLIAFGTGTVKGFGTALTIGLIVSMFTALVVTRLIFDFLLSRGWLKSLPMLNLVRGAKFDFMKFAKPAFIVSWLVIILGSSFGLYRGFVRKDIAGIEFRGGDNIQFSFQQKIPRDQVQSVVSGLKLGDSQVGYPRDLSSGRESLSITTDFGTADKVEQALKAKFPQAGFAKIDLQQVGASVGFAIQKSAIISLLLSLFGILVYVAFRYEFSFAVGAVLAVVHDVLMTFGIYCLTGLWGEGRQFNGTFVAAILTIVGFSINDTIVIFDRIREDLKLGARGSFKDIMNVALNQTLSRTIITSGTVFIATLSLYFFGGSGINDFAFTFLAGIITGTYSSIYIASAIVLWWHKGQRPKLGGAAANISSSGVIETNPAPAN